MKTITSLFLAVLLSSFTLVSAFGLGASDDPTGYSVVLQSSTYNASTNTTTFVYTVTSSTKPAISHWDLLLDPAYFSATSLVSAPANSYWITKDPSLSPAATFPINGIKFDTGYVGGEVRTVTIELAGQWATGPVEAIVKAGSTQGGTLSNWIMLSTLGPVFGPVVAPTYTISGNAFFDANFNGAYGAGEIGLQGITVTLLDSSNQVLATTTTAADGSYSFKDIKAGDYVVVVGSLQGLAYTTVYEHDLTVTNSDVTAPQTGLGLHFATLSTLTANGYTIGFWKTNIDKAIAGKTAGTQVSAATLSAYTTAIRGYALSPYSTLTLADASKVLSATGSDAAVLLSKQLLGSEYNLANGAYLGGNAYLTQLFIHWGEYVLLNASSYTRADVLWAKDWFDAYNNSHGGLVLGPSTL